MAGGATSHGSATVAGLSERGPAIKDATTPSAASPKTGQTRPGDPAQKCASATVSLPTDAVAVIQLSAFRCAYAMATRGTSSTTATSPAVSQPSGTPSSCRPRGFGTAGEAKSDP